MKLLPKYLLFLFCYLGNNMFLHAECIVPTAKSISEFSVSNVSRIAAVLKLGEDQHICFGVEHVDKRSLLNPISLSLSNVTVEQVLQKIFEGETRYSFSQIGNAILISKNLPGGAPVFLARSVSTFVAPRATVQQLSNVLWMQIQLDADPTIRGFAGSFPSGDSRDVVDGFNEGKVSIESVLFQLIERSRLGASWISTIDSTTSDRIPRQCPWKILEYDQHWEESGIFSTIASILEKNTAPKEPN